MGFRCAALLWFVLSVQWTDINSLETVEELLCQNMEMGSRIPHPEFCNVYIMCTDNAAMQISCQKRILFNPQTDVCDADYQVCHGGRIRNEDGTESVYVDGIEEEDEAESDAADSTEATTELLMTTSSQGLKFTTTTANQQTSNAVACPKVDSDKLVIVSHATKCSVYYICYHGKPVPMECSLGLYWSEQNYKCVPRELSECHARSANMYPKCPPEGIDFLPHHEDCRWFWFCRNGFRMLQQCDAFQHWDINERKCKLAGQSLCYKDLLKSNNP